jgi:CelD/BcsL family acetyltransferase involved in cellulose biosynthesis
MAEFVLGDFDAFNEPWSRILEKSNHRLLFSTPVWSRTWWQHFGSGSELCLGAVKSDDRIIGIAPLRLKDGTAHFIGGDDVCDFLDFVVEPGQETAFFETTVSFLRDKHIDSMDLSPLLPDSTVKQHLDSHAQGCDEATSCSEQDVTVAVDLPGDTPAYLSLLNGKQRHELLRKDRRLHEEGEVSFRISNLARSEDIEMFLRFFRESREDKNKFLTPEMETFFKAVIDMAGENGMLRLGELELSKKPVATTLGFDHKGDTYLYNSGYDPDYSWLSVGLLSKFYYIRSSIESGKKRFDFLKGAEKYKFHLGGKETPVFRCIIRTNC